MVYRENAMRLSPQRTAETAEGEEGTTVSTLQRPLPAWTGTAMQVPVPNHFVDVWDTSDSFAEAFCSVYQSLTAGYDAAVAEGRIRHDGDVVVDEDLPTAGLQKALLRGDGKFGAAELARQHGCCRQTVAKVASDLGVKIVASKSEARTTAERMFRDGETRPRVILAVLAEELPEGCLVRRNTITQWRLRWEAAEGQRS